MVAEEKQIFQINLSKSVKFEAIRGVKNLQFLSNDRKTNICSIFDNTSPVMAAGAINFCAVMQCQTKKMPVAHNRHLNDKNPSLNHPVRVWGDLRAGFGIQQLSLEMQPVLFQALV